MPCFLIIFKYWEVFKKKFKCIENLPEPLLILLRKKYIFRERRKIRVNLEIPVDIVVVAFFVGIFNAY